MSIRRNELVADLFARLHKVERAGTGIQRMRETLAEAGLKEPDFEVNGFFRTIFHRSLEFSLSAATQKIMEAIARNPEVTRRELAKLVGITADGIKYHLQQMQKRRLLRRIGADKGGHWEVVKRA